MRINILLLSFLLIFVTLLQSCAHKSTAKKPLPTVKFSVIASGDITISGLPENRKLEIFSNQASFNSSFNIYIHPTTEHTVDFSTKRVALISLGKRYTDGYSISLDKIEDFGDYIKAKVLIKKPDNNCVVSQAKTSPYEFIEIESTNEILFEEHVENQICI